MSTILKDVRSFISGKDLLVFAVGIAISNQLQTTLNTLIDALIMPFVSQLTGATNLASRGFNIPKTEIRIKWGAALNALITFSITLVIMVEIIKYISLRFKLKSSTVSWE